MARAVMLTARAAAPGKHAQILVEQPLNQTWGKNKVFNNFPILKKMGGFRPVMWIKKDEPFMRKYLNKVIPHEIQVPELGNFKNFMPAGAPLLDFFEIYQENMASWKFP